MFRGGPEARLMRDFISTFDHWIFIHRVFFTKYEDDATDYSAGLPWKAGVAGVGEWDGF